MGSSKSTNVANITSNIVSNEISNELSKVDLKGGQSQMISVVGGTGDVKIDGNVQRMQMTVDMTAVAKQMSSQTSQQSIVQQLSQAAAASTSGLNLFNSSDTDNTMNDVLNASMNVASNLAQICSASSNQSQVITVDQRDGKVDISGNIQEEMASVVGKCIQNAAASNKSLQEASQELSQTSSSKTVGLSIADLIILLIVGMLVTIGPIVIPMVAGVSGGITVVTALMGPILLVCGIVSIWWWSKHRTDIKKTMTATQFSTLISQDPTCGAQVYTPVGLNSPSAPPSSGNPLNDAGSICLNDPKCKAFDWDTSVNPPKVVYYSSVSVTPCPNVKVQDLQKAGIDLVAAASFYQGSSDPNKTVPTGAKAGDVYLNNSSGRWFWRVQTDSTQNPWIDITDGQYFPGWSSGATLVAGEMTTPQNSIGKDNDLYINTTDPNSWELWKRYSGKYGPLNSTDAGKLTNGPNGGTLLTIPYAQNNNMSFPGRHGVTKPAENYNWSAYVVTQDTSSYFWLILGIFLCFGGVAIICLKLYEWYKSKSASTKAGGSSAAKPSSTPIEQKK
jgi:hypothetical protein